MFGQNKSTMRFSLTAVCVLLVVLLLLLLVPTQGVEATWRLLLPGSRRSILESLLGGTSTSSVKIVARNTVAKFQTKLQSDRSVFPGSCVSDQPDLPYGWEAYKKEIIRSLSVSVNLNQITILLWPRIGYSITVDETITCGPFKSEFDEPYWLGDSLAVDDQKFSFSITRAPRTSVSLFKLVDIHTPQYIPTDIPDLGKYPVTSQLDEGQVRDLGLNVYIVLANDNWDATKLEDIGAGLTCTPVDCFAGLVDKTLFKYDSNVPNVVSLNLNRTHMRTFDIDQHVTIKFSLPNNGRKFGLKGDVNIEMPPKSNSFYIVTSPVEVGASAEKPVVTLTGAVLGLDTSGEPIRRIRDTTTALNSLLSNLDPLKLNTMYLEEKCLRGKDPVSDCNRTLLFTLPPTFPSQTQRFALSSSNSTTDIQQYTMWSSKAMVPFDEMPWYEYNGWEDNRQDGSGTQAMIRLARLPEYEIWTQDVITITLPFSCFTQQEPPSPSGGNPLRLVVTPSPTTFYGGLRDIEQREIWKTELVQYLILDGESWTEGARQNLLHNTAGQILPPALGYNTQKVQLLGHNGAVEYARTATGRLNYTMLVITFKKMPEFEMDVDPEVIYFGINTTWVRSGLTLTVPAGLNKFVIKKSPGELTVIYNPLLEESDMIAGGYNLSITLAGDKWTIINLALCKAALCGAWNSSNQGKDPNGWENERGNLCDPSNMTLRADQRTIDMVLVPDIYYNTKKGENISIRVPAICSVTGTKAPVAPDGFPEIKVLPQNGNVTWEVSYDGGLTRENLTAISEGALREATATIYAMTHGDNWDDENAAAVGESVFNMSLSNAFGTFGWNNKKHEMLAEPMTNLMKWTPPLAAREIRFTFKPVSTFDLAANETVTLDLLPWWMASNRKPIIPVINFTIYASPGVVEIVEWAGTYKKVTEDDMRWGRVWFQFRIVGEQWRRDSQPFIKSFSSNDTLPTALNALVASLIPAIEFFNFTVTPDGYEYLRLTLQSQNLYDINDPENCTISLQPNTVVSGIQPIFEYPFTQRDCTIMWDNVTNTTQTICTSSTFTIRSTNFSFMIYPSPARVFVSGGIHLLNEKKMRQSTLTHVFLTLVGDTWAQNISWTQDPVLLADSSTPIDAAYYLRRNITAIPDPPTEQNLRGYSLINDTILPKSSFELVNPHVMLLKFVADRRYKLNTTEIIDIFVEPNATKSTIAPYNVRALKLYVDATGGELRFADESLVVTELMLRTAPVQISLAIDGDSLNWPTISKDSGAFLNKALKSESSILAEPHGFTKNRLPMLRMTRGQQPLMVQGTSLDLASLIVKKDITGNNTNSTNGTVTGTTTAAPTTTTTAAPTNGTGGDAIKLIPKESSFSFGLMMDKNFDIRNDENLILTMRDSDFFGTKITADPASVVLTIKKVPQVMVMLLDQSRSFSRTYQTDPLALRTRIANLFSIPYLRVVTEENKPPFTPEGLLIMRVWFVDDLKTQSNTGYLTNAFLTDTFMSLYAPFLDTSLAAKLVYYEDAPPADLGLGNGGTTFPVKAPVQATDATVWGIIGGILIILGTVLFVVGLILQKARLSLSSLRPAGQREVFKTEGKYEMDKELEEKEAQIRESVNNGTVKLAESPFFVGREAKQQQAEAQAAKQQGRLRQAHEEGIQVVHAPMSMREYARTNMAKSSGAKMGLDALGLSPKDIREAGTTLDEELAGEKDETQKEKETERVYRESKQAEKYFSVDAASKRERLDGHHTKHSRDHRKIIDLMADL